METKIEAQDLCKNRTFEETKAILREEGNTFCENGQFKEWWDIFELLSLCNKAEMSEVEKWCVLRGRFELKRK